MIKFINFITVYKLEVRADHVTVTYLSTAALSESQALNLSLQRAQLLPEPGLSSFQRLLHLLLTIDVIPVALPLHLPNLRVAVALQAGQTALKAVQDLGPHSGQLDVQDVVQMSGGAGAGDGPASSSFQQLLQLAIMTQDHPLRTHTGEKKENAAFNKGRRRRTEA